MVKKDKIDKIIITGQALRGNFYPIKWIWNVFSYYIHEVSQLPVYYVAGCDDKEERYNTNSIKFDVNKFYSYYQIRYENEDLDSENGKQVWSYIYYNNEYNQKSYEYVYSFYKDALVINFETEECIINILDYYNIQHIDINLDPIRFLDDIMLCFKTDNKKVYNKLLEYKVDEELLYLKANYISSVYKLNNNYNNYREKNALFLGQTVCDKTLIDKRTNELYSIINHKDEFLKAVEGFDNIYYKRHPYIYNDEEVMEFVTSIKNIKIIDDNFYKLLSRPDIKKVISISSGSCSEAKYFGKETQTLLLEGVPRQIENKFDKDKYVSVYQDTFSLNFWSDILSPIIKTKKYTKKYLLAGNNMFRYTKPCLFYSYEDFNIAKCNEEMMHYVDANAQMVTESVKNNVHKTARMLLSMRDEL